MHLLVVATEFPSAKNPYPGSFIGQQVRLLSEHIARITVLSPITYIPSFLQQIKRVSIKGPLPQSYQLVGTRCEVFFPRYIKAPGNIFLPWTMAQWCRIVSQFVAQYIKTCPITLIHANGGNLSSWAAIRAAKRYNIPCVVTYQGTEVHTVLANQLKGWRLCRDSFRLADLNLFVSSPLEDILRLHAEPKGRCETLLRGVDLARFFPSSELSLEPRVIFVGRVEKAKGIFDLLSAWARVMQACHNAQLIVVGQDCTNGGILEEVRSRGIENSVSLTGPLPPEKIAQLMRQARLLCLPSHGEGTPNCVMEALSSGIPVVATRVGGIPNIVKDQRTGFLVDKGDVQELASSLICLLQDTDRSARMGQAAYVFAQEHLDARKSVSRLVELYDEVIVDYAAKKLGRTSDNW